jgi:hypothetical protein
MKWEGEVPAEPKRQRVVNSEWRLAISDWCVIFLEGSAPALPKIFGASADAPSSYGISGSPGGSPSQMSNKFGAQENPSNPMSLAPCPLPLTG